jgi:hypothetical protein
VLAKYTLADLVANERALAKMLFPPVRRAG